MPFHWTYDTDENEEVLAMTTTTPTSAKTDTYAQLTEAAPKGRIITDRAAKALAVLRIATGFTFLWAFLDKTFGLGWATPEARAWINGGSPTKGFLSNVKVGPFASFFNDIAGATWANWLFMIGLLGIGIAMVAGVAVRSAAVSGSVLLGLMWLAEWPLARHVSGGAASGSTNPLVDSHVISALALAVVAMTYAGTTWGLGKLWARIPFVSRHPWAI
jgi:thiosulfate dehydrogenase [quinone] large subunit